MSISVHLKSQGGSCDANHNLKNMSRNKSVHHCVALFIKESKTWILRIEVVRNQFLYIPVELSTVSKKV